MLNKIDATFLTLKKINENSFLTSFIDLLKCYEHEFAIQGFTIKTSDNPRYLPINMEDISMAIKKTSILIIGSNLQPYFKIYIDLRDGLFFVDRYMASSISFHIDHIYFFENNIISNDKIHRFLVFCDEIYSLTNPLCGHIHDSLDELAISVALGRSGITRFLGIRSVEFGHIKLPHINCPISGIYWANYFGPGCVEFFGKQTINNLQGLNNYTELNDGGIVFFTSANPLTPDSEQSRANQLAIWKQLKITPLPKKNLITKYKNSVIPAKTNWSFLPLLRGIKKKYM